MRPSLIDDAQEQHQCSLLVDSLDEAMQNLCFSAGRVDILVVRSSPVARPDIMLILSSLSVPLSFWTSFGLFFAQRHP